MTIEDNRKPPEWLNSNFITEALRQSWNDPFLQVKSLDIKPATAVGDNYASIMFRAVLMIMRMPTMEEERFSLVIKTLPKGEALQEFIKSVFNREAEMFLTILPEINKRLQDVIPDHKLLNASCVWFGIDPEPVLILEDLKEIGYGLADRMGGLDISTTNMVLENLAKLHAGSVAVAKSDPEKLESFLENFWEKNEDIAKMAKMGLEGLIEEVSEWDDFPNEYVEKLRNIKPVVVERMREALAFDESFLNVLLHGDCWINNMMVYPDQHNVEMIRFVDFQMCAKGSACIDLNYFIFTSPNINIRLNIDEMLMTYYKSFMETIEILGIDLDREFTFEDLKNDFQKRAFFGFIALIIIYPITVTEKNNVQEIDEIMSENGSKRKTYQNEIFKKMFQLTIPYFLDCGVL